MLTDLKLSPVAAATGTAATMVKEAPAAQATVEAPAIKRKLAGGDVSRENQLYTRAWAIYSRARNRRVARAVSIF